VKTHRGGALLAVLWLSAALAAIAFSVAVTVRGEISRSENLLDGVKAYYLASGAIDRTILYHLWGPTSKYPDGSPRYNPALPFLNLRFSTGEAVVEILPESAKLSINDIEPRDLQRLLTYLGVNAEAAQTLTASIVDWRTPSPGPSSPMDAYYLSQNPSFRARHASLQEIEELLLVRGMTPELFYGRYETGPDGKLLPVAGLRDCLTVYRAEGGIDVNTAQPAVLATIGVIPQGIEAIVAQRRIRPLTIEQLNNARPALGPGGSRLKIGGGSILTFRATARLNSPDGRLSDLRRTVSATVRFNDVQVNPGEPYTILRWRENDPPERLLFEAWTR
jgi:general secretion pathway protein K